MEESERQSCIESNRREYGDACESMRWVTPEEARDAEAERAALLGSLRGRVSWCFGSTKADCRDLSPGCRACLEGSWSCLFVNGVCNARCYYCPSEQRDVGEPATNTLTFARPEDYAAYLERLCFRGASMSGGEPLLTMERTVGFLAAARAALGPPGRGGHLWMYTNAILLTEERLDRLVEAGLDELRIDLTATDYALAPVRLAATRVPTVTVEIPALPQDEARLASLLPELVASGVRHLNLHELRATPHNLPRLVRQGHPFRHGRRVTVHGSELAALRLLRLALDRGIALPVNYCSSVYKLLSQARAARLRAARAAGVPQEELTEAGYIRERVERGAGEATVRYHAASLRPRPTYRASFREIELARGASIVVEREPVSGPMPPGSRERERFERMPEGLEEYF